MQAAKPCSCALCSSLSSIATSNPCTSGAFQPENEISEEVRKMLFDLEKGHASSRASTLIQQGRKHFFLVDDGPDPLQPPQRYQRVSRRAHLGWLKLIRMSVKVSTRNLICAIDLTKSRAYIWDVLFLLNITFAWPIRTNNLWLPAQTLPQSQGFDNVVRKTRHSIKGRYRPASIWFSLFPLWNDIDLYLSSGCAFLNPCNIIVFSGYAVLNPCNISIGRMNIATKRT